MACDAIFFDLDGTLADTLEGIAQSMNRTLADFGLPGHEVAAYRQFVGNGVRRLVERALPAGQQHRAEEFLAVYLPRLEDHGAALARLYDGVTDMLDALADRGLRLAVYSNKPHAATVDVVERLMGQRRFAVVRGHVDGTPVKPDPTVVLRMAGDMGVDPARTAYLGDSDVDMQLARRAGFLALGAAWGLRGREELLAHGADHVLDQPRDLIALVETL